MIAEALRYADDPNAPRVEGCRRWRGAGDQPPRGGGGGESWGGRTRRVLMTGVSLHDPVRRRGRPADRARRSCSAATRSSAPYGDILPTTRCPTCPTRSRSASSTRCSTPAFSAYIGALFFVIGKTAFTFFIPALAGYIAYAIADRPGLAPGFVMGGLAAVVTQFGTPRPASSAHRRRRARRRDRALDRPAGRCPTWARGLMPVMVIPLFTTLDRRRR